MHSPRRLVVLAPNWLGDAVMALPLLTDLRRGWPDSEIVVAARQGIAPLFAMVPAVSGILALEGGGGSGALRRATRNAVILQGGAFDAALLLPNSFVAAWLAWRAGIKERWGYARDLRGRLLTLAMPRPKRYRHQAEYYQMLASGLGINTGERFAAIEVPTDARSAATVMLRDAGVAADQRFVIFAPGAAYGRAKQWLPERFAELARMLGRDAVRTVLVGARGDTRACDEVATLARRGPSPTEAINVAGRTDLATLAALFSMAAAVVANDSGAMHLAAAVGTRVSAVFGPTDDTKTSPLSAGASAPAPRIIATDVWCRPCMLRECPIDHRCMSRISAQTVLESITT